MGIRFYRDQNLPFLEIKNCDGGIHASRNHIHEEFSVGLILKGSSIITGAGKNYMVNACSTIIIPPNVIHQCNPKNVTNWQFKMLYLKTSWVHSLIETLPNQLFISIKNLNNFDYQSAIRMVTMLQSNASSIEKETQLISSLNYLFDFENYFQLKFSYQFTDYHSLQRVHDYLHEHFLEKISLDDLMKVSGLSKYHLVRIFKQIYQTPPHAYQTMLRINYAKRALKKRPHESISQIAQNAGFFDQSHFIKTFKLYSGTTPINYRLGKR